jgi:hypothetical protein
MHCNPRKLQHRILVLSVAALLPVIVAPTGARAQPPVHHNLCPPGATCHVPNPRLINVFWEASKAAWDARVSTSTTVAGATNRALDDFVRGLAESEYFDGLSQYGVSRPVFQESFATPDCGGPPPPTANLDDMRRVVQCVKNNHALPADAVINLFIPPQSTPAWVGGNDLQFGNCSIYVGFHILLADIPTAIIPLQCSPSFAALTVVISHEIVEAVTDRDPTGPEKGWVDTNPAHIYTGGSFPVEAADVCITKSNPLRNIGVELPPASFLSGLVPAYWSNSANACVFGFATPNAAIDPGFSPPFPTPTPTPQPSPGVFIGGTGRNMRIRVSGTNFGPRPWDFNGGGPQDTLYFDLSNNTRGWRTVRGPARSAPPNLPVFTTWTNQLVEIEGINFGAGGTNIGPGDSLSITVMNVATGAAASATGSAPMPARVSRLGTDFRAPWYPPIVVQATPGAHGALVGRIVDANDFSVENVPGVTLTADGLPLLPSTLTDAFGSFNTPFTPTRAGLINVDVTVNVTPPLSSAPPAHFTNSFQIPVSPTVNSVAPNHVGVDGGVEVIITGSGFVPNQTQAEFGGVQGTAPQVLDSQHLKVTVPASPLPDDPNLSPGRAGDREVVVKVEGVPSQEPLALSYVVPHAPMLRVSERVCGGFELTVESWNGDGTPYRPFDRTGERPRGGAVVGLHSAGASFASASNEQLGVEYATVDLGFDGRAVVNVLSRDNQTRGLQVTAVNQSDSNHPSRSLTAQFLSRDGCGRMGQFAGRDDFKTLLDLSARLVPFVCTACMDEGESLVIWDAARTEGGRRGFYALLRADGVQTAATGLDVMLLRPSEAAALTARVRSAEVRRGVLESNLRLASPVVLLSSNSADVADAISRGGLRIAFAYDAKENPAELAIYRLAAARGRPRWTKADIAWESITPGTVAAKVLSAGVYAVVATPNPKRVCSP